MSTTSPVSIAQNLASKLISIDGIDFVLLIGSHAVGNADQYSDLDILFYYTEDPSEEKIKEVLNVPNANKFRLDDEKYHIPIRVPEISTTLMGIHISSISRLVDQYPDITYKEYYELFTYIVQARLLAGDETIFEAWKDKVNDISPELKQKTIAHHIPSLKYWITQEGLLKQAKRGEWLYVNEVLQDCVKWALTVIYMLNNQMFINSKRARQKLEQMEIKPSNTISILEEASLAINSYEGMERNIERLSVFFEELKLLAEKHNS